MKILSILTAGVRFEILSLDAIKVIFPNPNEPLVKTDLDLANCFFYRQLEKDKQKYAVLLAQIIFTRNHAIH